MASRSSLNQMREIHGEESPWWRSNILGIFPGQESVRFIDTDVIPKRLQDKDVAVWRPDPEECRARLHSLVAEVLPPLRAAEARLRTQCEELARAGAVDRAPARLSRDEVALNRELRSQEQTYQQATAALVKLYKQSAAMGLPPVTAADRARRAELFIPQACSDEPGAPGLPVPSGPGAGARRRPRTPILPPFARRTRHATAQKAPDEPARTEVPAQIGPGPDPRPIRSSPVGGGEAAKPGSEARYRIEAVVT
jgi:hypothetical protein